MAEGKTKKIIGFCRICGTATDRYHFGVLACNPCKMFFKRNAEYQPTKFRCLFVNQCHISSSNRHSCNACRLMKCFQSGMSTDRFHAPIKRSKRKGKTTNVTQLPTLSLLRQDRSSLTANQWVLIKNLFYNYQESQLLSIGQSLIHIFRERPMEMCLSQKFTKDFLASIYETATRFLRFNADFNRLSVHDRSIVLRNATEKLACMGGGFVMQLLNLFHFDHFSSTLMCIYGEKATDLTRRAMNFIDSDLVLIKLTFALMIVSEDISTLSRVHLSEPKRLFDLQNRYAELTWKYLQYRYNDEQAVKLYLRLVLWMRATIVLVDHIRNLHRHVNDLNSIVEQTELTLILDDADEIMQSQSSIEISNN